MIYDEFANSIFQYYSMFVMTINGIYQVAKQEGVSPKSIATLQQNGKASVQTFCAMSELATQTYLSNLTQGELTEILSKTKSVFLFNLQKAATDNLNELILRAKGADHLSDHKMTDSPAMQALLKKHFERSTFQIKDKAGRNWQADRYIKTLARQFAVNAMVDYSIKTLSEKSDVAKIEYEDKNHEGNGLVISLKGVNKDLPSLESIHSKVFHPHSTARLVSHV